jgi:hypothetical protein
MSVQGRPPRASVRRPPGEDKALAGSAAPSAGALAVAARQLDMSEQKIFDLALARSAWRSMVAVRLGAGHARPARSKIPMPALTNLAKLGHASAFAGVDRQRILYDDSAPTELERADGNWRAVARRLGAPGGGTGATVASLASEFDRHLAPSIRQPRTRADYWRAWRLVVRYGHLGGGTQGAGCGLADVAHDAESTDVGLGLLRGANVAGRDGLLDLTEPAAASPRLWAGPAGRYAGDGHRPG